MGRRDHGGGGSAPGNTCEVEVKGEMGWSQFVGHQWKFPGLDATTDLRRVSQALVQQPAEVLESDGSGQV